MIMLGGVDKFDVAQLQALVKEDFAKIKTQPYEMGTCKRVFQLPNNIGLAVTHSNTLMEKDLIHDELFYLAYLKDHGYPVINTHGAVFAVEGEGDNTRYGFLMDYVPQAVFIETKSPALLKAQIFAALLGIPTQASEGWWALNHSKLFTTIATKINHPEAFAKLQITAAQLFNNINNLIEKLTNEKLAIADLQIMVSNDGRLTIIDPLDVVKVNLEAKTIVSVLHPETPPAAGFEVFLSKTGQWLESARKHCEMISKAYNPEHLKSYVGPASHRSSEHSSQPAPASRSFSLKPIINESLKPKK